MGLRDFRELAAWKRADELRGLCLVLLELPPVKRDFKYWNQMSDAAGSAPRNIAEGFGRYRHKEFAQFVRIAKGSECENLDVFIEGRKKGYISDKDFPKHETAARRDPRSSAPSTQHLGTQHLGTQHLGTQHLGTLHLGTLHLGTQHLGTQHLGTRHFDTRHEHLGTGHYGTLALSTATSLVRVRK